MEQVSYELPQVGIVGLLLEAQGPHVILVRRKLGWRHIFGEKVEHATGTLNSQTASFAEVAVTRGGCEASEGLQVAPAAFHCQSEFQQLSREPRGSFTVVQHPPSLSHKVTSKALENSVGVTAGGGFNMTDALASAS